MSVRNHLVFLRQNAGRILLDPAVNDCRFSGRSRGRQMGRERQIMRLKRKHIRVGLPTALLLIGAIWGYSTLPVAWGNPELHRGWTQPALSLVGKRYSVSFKCERGNRRNERPGTSTMMVKSFLGSRFNHFLAWNHDDAILFAASVEPDCKILRLSHLTRRWWWGSRYKTRRYNAHPVIGPEI